MPRIVDYDKRRQSIASAAVSVFARIGYTEASLSEIALHCGLGRTTLYKYFRNKKEILLFALEERFSQVEAEAATLLAEKGLDHPARLLRLFEFLARSTIEDREEMLLILDLTLRFGKTNGPYAIELRQRLDRLQLLFESVLREGLDEGQFRDLDPSTMAQALLSLLEAYALQSSVSDAFGFSGVMAASNILIEGLRAEEGREKD